MTEFTITPLRALAAQLVAASGRDLNSTAIKVKESKACAKKQTIFPAFDVYVRAAGQSRGQHLLTVIYL